MFAASLVFSAALGIGALAIAARSCGELRSAVITSTVTPCSMCRRRPFLHPSLSVIDSAGMESQGDGLSKAVTSKRIWLLAGLAAMALVCLLISICGLGAYWAFQFPAGDPPGQDDRAQRGYQASAPVIAALENYRQAHGQYPATLDALVPDEPAAVPVSVNDYPITYHAAPGSYTLEFSYTGPSMFIATMTVSVSMACLMAGRKYYGPLSYCPSLRPVLTSARQGATLLFILRKGSP